MFADLWQSFYNLPFSATVRESSWVFPVFECIHLYSMVFLIGLVAAFDLKLMGFSLDSQPVSSYSAVVRRWVWIPLGANAITGSVLFASKAPEYSRNSAFVVKMLLLAVGFIYHALVVGKARRWDQSSKLPAGVSVLGGFSLALWIGVVAASRWIAYVN